MGSLRRRCSRIACSSSAVATLTYVYVESTAVVGPLATSAEPHSYDLCHQHADRLTAPIGWDLLRLDFETEDLLPTTDDLEALANAVREAARPHVPEPSGPGGVGRRGHLRVLRTPTDA